MARTSTTTRSPRPGRAHRVARSLRWPAALVGAALIVGACTGSEPATTTVDELGVTTTEVIADPAGDGRLRVGVILPLTGQGSELGTVMLDAIELAERRIDPIGVQGRDIDVVTVDETTLTGTISSIEDLFPGEIDAVIGPGSSLVAERIVPLLTDAGLFTCSPTASALSLDALADSAPLFIRTVPSDSLQAKALARMLDRSGTSIVLAYVDDAFGEPFAELVQRELAVQGAPAAQLIGFDPQQSDYSTVAADIVATGAATIGIIGDPEAGPRLVQFLAEVIDTTVQTTIWMNDAMRVPATAGTYRRLDEDVLAIMGGVSPRSTIDDSVQAFGFPENGTLFGANAYDCLNVIALAADQSEFIDGATMADQVVPTTSGGTPCRSYQACVEQLRANRNIDYEGPLGDLDIDADGDLGAVTFDVYRFEDGLDVRDLEVTPPRVS